MGADFGFQQHAAGAIISRMLDYCIWRGVLVYSVAIAGTHFPTLEGWPGCVELGG